MPSVKYLKETKNKDDTTVGRYQEHRRRTNEQSCGGMGIKSVIKVKAPSWLFHFFFLVLKLFSYCYFSFKPCF